jgi:exosome complex RNA-binding protein Rrp4
MTESMDYAEDFLNKMDDTIAASQRKLVVPGNDLSQLFGSDVKIGPGLVQTRTGRVVATVAGDVQSHASTFWVASSSKRYSPVKGDHVVGIVENKGGDYYHVQCWSGSTCIMNRLAFDGATKRNKPELKKVLNPPSLYDTHLLNPPSLCLYMVYTYLTQPLYMTYDI